MPLPFQTRATVAQKKLEGDKELMEMFQKVEINTPLLRL